MQVNPVIPPKPSTSAPSAWGSSMAESARSILDKMLREERDLIAKRDRCLNEDNVNEAMLCERLLTTEKPAEYSGEPIPLRIRIAEMRADIAAYEQTVHANATRNRR